MNISDTIFTMRMNRRATGTNGGGGREQRTAENERRVALIMTFIGANHESRYIIFTYKMLPIFHRVSLSLTLAECLDGNEFISFPLSANPTNSPAINIMTLRTNASMAGEAESNRTRHREITLDWAKYVSFDSCRMMIVGMYHNQLKYERMNENEILKGNMSNRYFMWYVACTMEMSADALK